jgi:ankyrin repeat protein
MESKNEEGGTPLVCAVVEGKAEVVEELAKRGAKVGVAVDGMTTLSVASERGFIDVVKILFQFGMKPPDIAASGAQVYFPFFVLFLFLFLFFLKRSKIY